MCFPRARWSAALTPLPRFSAQSFLHRIHDFGHARMEFSKNPKIVECRLGTRVLSREKKLPVRLTKCNREELTSVKRKNSSLLG